MDAETIGLIEKKIDHSLEWIEDIIEDIRVLEEVLPIRSPEEFVLAYTIGFTHASALSEFIREVNRKGKRMKLTKADIEESVTEIKRMLRRRIPEIREKILTELGR